MPISVPGELYLGGPKVARGYIHRPDLTHTAFVSALPIAGRQYKTGDRVRWLQDGNLEFLGRMDFQIKLNGQRIETGEIEAVLRQAAGVQEALVLVDQTPAGMARLVAYVVPADVEREVLINVCQSQLPGYMVPSVVVALEEWPLNANGKVDRKLLPAPEWGKEQAANHVAARTGTEQWLVDAAQQVLQVQSVSANADLLGLGLTSLLAVRLSSLLGTRNSVRVSSTLIMQHRTVCGIAKAALTDVACVRPPLVPQQHVSSGVALSYEQEQMWVLYQLDPQSAAYNVPHVQRLRGHIQVGQLVAAMDVTAKHHSVLRMKYANADDGECVQQWAVPIEQWSLPVCEVSAAREAAAELIIADEVETAFELAVSSVRLLVVHIGLDEHIVVLNVHHMATDGWSTAILTTDVVLAYNAHLESSNVSLGSGERIQYMDYAIWQRQLLADKASMEVHVQYWQDALDGELPVLEVHTDFPRPAVMTTNGASVPVLVDSSTAQALEALCRSCGFTMMRGVLAAWAVLLGKHSGQEEVVVGIPYANREHPATHEVVGYFVNTLAIRVGVDGIVSFRDMVVETGKSVSKAVEHADLPFMKVVEAVAPERDASRSPVYQTMLTWEEAAGWDSTSEGFVGLEVIELAAEEDAATIKFDIELFLGRSGKMCNGAVDYNADLFASSTVHRLVDHFVVLMQKLVEAADVALCEVSVMDAAEQELVMETWNATQQPYPTSVTAHSLFEVQACKDPDAVAVLFGVHRVTYSELLVYTSRLAGCLQASGVNVEKVVGLCVQKSVAEVAGMVGIMRAGAAYVPLDSKLPLERLQFLVEQCACDVVLAQEKYGGLAGSLGASVVLAEAVMHGKGDCEWAGREMVVPCGSVSSSQLAYVLFTSGSTGKPKGVMVEHASLVVFLRHESTDGPYKLLRDGWSDVRLYVLAYTFDVSVAAVLRTTDCWSTVVYREARCMVGSCVLAQADAICWCDKHVGSAICYGFIDNRTYSPTNYAC